MKLLRLTPKPRFCTFQDKQIQGVSLSAQLQILCQTFSAAPQERGLQTPLLAAAISCKGVPVWHLGHQPRDTTKELRYDSTTVTFRWGQVSLALTVVLPRDFQCLH